MTTLDTFETSFKRSLSLGTADSFAGGSVSQANEGSFSDCGPGLAGGPVSQTNEGSFSGTVARLARLDGPGISVLVSLG